MNTTQQWTGRSAPGREAPEQHYLVGPRHLAGSGDLRYITAYLRAAGWTDRTPRSGAPVRLDSPDRTIRIGYPGDTAAPTWTIAGGSGNDPAGSWHATFSSATPVEVIAGFTDALAQPPTPNAPNVWAPLTAQGWAITQGQHYTASSPDGTAILQFRQEKGTAMWWPGASVASGNRSVPVWRAVFSGNVPMRTMEGFAKALSDPQPLLRPPGHVPFTAARHVSTTPYPVLPSQLASWQQSRIASARAAGWAMNAWAINSPRRNAQKPPTGDSARRRR